MFNGLPLRFKQLHTVLGISVWWCFWEHSTIEVSPAHDSWLPTMQFGLRLCSDLARELSGLCFLIVPCKTAPLLFVWEAFRHSQQPSILGGNSTLVSKPQSRPFFPSSSLHNPVREASSAARAAGLYTEPAGASKTEGAGAERAGTRCLRRPARCGAGAKCRCARAGVCEDDYPHHGSCQTTSAYSVACKLPRKNTVSSVISNEGETIYEAEKKKKKDKVPAPPPKPLPPHPPAVPWTSWQGSVPSCLPPRPDLDSLWQEEAPRGALLLALTLARRG